MRFGRFLLRCFALVLAALVAGLGFLYWRDHQPARENRYDPLIAAAARNEGLDPFLVRALIWRESRFIPTRLGLAQEHGLMQVTPAVGQEWAKSQKITDYKDDDLYDPETNIRAGTWYLAHAIRHWNQTDDPVTFALAEYNAGRGNALKWVDASDPTNHLAFMDRITFPSTRKYVETILEMRDQFRESLARSPSYRDFLPASNSVTVTP